MNPQCSTCGKDLKGFTCQVCNDHFETSDAAHADCEGMIEAKCVGCNKAETACAC